MDNFFNENKEREENEMDKTQNQPIIMNEIQEEHQQADEYTYQSNKYETAQESTADENNKPGFYREVIEKKTKTSKLLIASVLSAGLMLGTIVGYTVDNYFLANYKSSRETSGILTQTNITSNTPPQYLLAQGTVSIEWIAEKVSPAVVSIQTKAVVNDFFFGSFENEGIGSGVIISSEGLIVTNNHVISNANDIKVILSDGRKFDARLVNRDAEYDLAILKIEGKNLPYAEFADSSTLKVGQLAVAIGNPLGQEYAGTVTAGIISGLDREFKNQGKTLKLIQTDAAINPGNSGGALVNTEGKVIGINTLKVAETKVEGMGFAIPSSEVKTIIDELINRPLMGIEGRTITKEESERYSVPQGVYISRVTPFGGADRAGIKAGDIITAIDGKKITTIEELVETVKKHKAEDIIEVELLNQLNRKSTVKVKLSNNAE